MEHEVLEPSTPSYLATMRQAVGRYSAALDEHEDVLEWLDNRGIDRETAHTNRLGVVEDPIPGHEKYSGMLALPYLNPNDDAVQVRFRCLRDHDHVGHGKYNNVSGEPGRMYNTNMLLMAGSEIHVCEGEFDAMILGKMGWPSVALPGATTYKPRHRVNLSGFSRVWVWGDPDDAGVEFNSKITRSLRQARSVQLKQDVSDTYVNAGPFALQAALDHERKQLGDTN